MTTKVVGLALLAALVTLAPLAVASDSGNTTEPARPDDAAWVEDCPPDMMCAASDTPNDNNTTEENTTRGPEDCENCRFGPDDCIDCMGMPVADGDDTAWGTDCPPGVYCMADGGAPEAERDAAKDETGEAPLLGISAFVAGLLALAFVAQRRL